MNLIPEKEIINYISAELAWHYRIIPHQIHSNTLTLLIDKDFQKEDLINELEFITGYEIKTIGEEAEKIQQLLTKSFRKKATADKHLIGDNADDFLTKIIHEAKNLQSSDIHIESYSERCRIRLRIDGKLIELYNISKEQYPSFINKIKIKSKLDIAEKRLPQDGRILIIENGEKTDIRVSVLPALYGEKIVLRLLNNDSSHIHLDGLGLDDKQLLNFKKSLKKPHGIMLISGPTGSGKTTTLYATLKLLNSDTINILTIEDPIEYTLEGVNQVQLKESIGLTFASTLRTFLRQDPDIIMLGEIRDGETAQMAIRAALTGHLVLSTIHTNSAWGTVSRLVDMGIPSYLLASTLNMTIAQRLVRKLCNACKQKQNPDIASIYPDLKNVLTADDDLYTPTGCQHCYYTGYSGRMAIYEVLPVDAELSLMIKENSYKIDAYCKKNGITSLHERALELVKNGTTSLEEIYPILLNH